MIIILLLLLPVIANCQGLGLRGQRHKESVEGDATTVQLCLTMTAVACDGEQVAARKQEIFLQLELSLEREMDQLDRMTASAGGHPSAAQAAARAMTITSPPRTVAVPVQVPVATAPGGWTCPAAVI